MAQLNIDDVLFDELLLDIFSFLDLKAVRNVRLVSKKWKNLVIEANPEFQFVVHLTDKKISRIKNLTETHISLLVYDYTGKKNKVVPANEGPGLLFRLAEKITFGGKKVDRAEIEKLMPFAIDTVRELSYFYFGKGSIMRPLLGKMATFSALRKLEIYARSSSFTSNLYGSSTRFDCYTSIIKKLAAIDSGPQMPSLESLVLSYDFDPGGTYGHCGALIEQMFANFLAISKLILKYKRTLREIEIDFTGATDGQRNPKPFITVGPLRLKEQKKTEMKECIEAFHELVNLNRIHCRSVNIRDHPWDWELQLLRRPKNLKELNIVQPRINSFEYYDFPEMVSLLFPENTLLLTTVKILSHKPNQNPDLGVLGHCPNLKTLWLEFYAYRISPTPARLMHFTNVDKLSRHITSLRLKSDRKDELRRQYAILSREQIRWIVDNLKGLKSFWTQLVLQPTHNQNVAGNSNDKDALQPQENDAEDHNKKEFVSSPSNIDIQLFQEITKMPKISDLKFDLMKSSNLADRIPVDEIREYTEMFKDVASVKTTCKTFRQVRYERPVAYTELTIKIDRFFVSQ